MAEALKQIKQGDTTPFITATLKDSAGDPVDLTDATVRFLLRDAFTWLEVLAEDAVNDQNGDGSDGSKGQVHYEWQAGDTDDAGLSRGEFEVTYYDQTVESFPNGGYIFVEILPKSADVAVS